MMLFTHIARGICKNLKKEHNTTLVVLLPFFLQKQFQQAVLHQQWRVQYILVHPDKTEIGKEAINILKEKEDSVQYLFFGLFSAYQQHAVELLHTLQQQKDTKIYIADVRLAQRNIDYPAYWYTQIVYRLFLHKQVPQFPSFMQQGAIEGLATALDLPVIQRKDLAFGAFSLLYL